MKSSSEISPTLQPHPLFFFTTNDVIYEGNHGEIKEKSGNLVRQNCSLPTPRPTYPLSPFAIPANFLCVISVILFPLSEVSQSVRRSSDGGGSQRFAELEIMRPLQRQRGEGTFQGKPCLIAVLINSLGTQLTYQLLSHRLRKP